MNDFFVFTFNVFINSFLMFITVVALIESVIFLFRIRSGRLTSLLRMLPIVKLPFDLIFYDFSSWSYLKGINPLTAEEGSRVFTVAFGQPSFSEPFFLPFKSGIQFTVNHMTFTVADMISVLIDPFALSLLCSFVLCVSICLFVKSLFIYLCLMCRMKNGKENANKKTQNPFIHQFLRKSGAEIISSPFSVSPFVYGLFSAQIHIPVDLYKILSNKEYEAVLAHEFEHIRYKDNLMRFVLTLICSIFWWIPTKWLRKRIEEGQEIGCDSKCKHYGINPITLAAAIHKSAKFSLNSNPFAHHLAKHLIGKRTHLLLKTPLDKWRKMHSLGCCIAAMIAFFVIFLGRYWIF